LQDVDATTAFKPAPQKKRSRLTREAAELVEDNIRHDQSEKKREKKMEQLQKRRKVKGAK